MHDQHPINTKTRILIRWHTASNGIPTAKTRSLPGFAFSYSGIISRGKYIYPPPTTFTFFSISNQQTNFTKPPTTSLPFNQIRKPHHNNKATTKRTFFTVLPTRQLHQTPTTFISLNQISHPHRKNNKTTKQIFFTLLPTSHLNQTHDDIHFIQPSNTTTAHQQRSDEAHFLDTPTNKLTTINPRRRAFQSTKNGAHTTETKKRRRAISLQCKQ